MQMDGLSGRAGWRWIFITEGLVSFLFRVNNKDLTPTDYLRGSLHCLLFRGRFSRKG